MKFRLLPATAKRRGGSGTEGSGSTGHAPAMTCLSSLFITTSLLLSLPTATNALTEKEVLHHLHSNLNGDNWDTPWDVTDEDPCSTSSYPGVTCNSDGKITQISLSDNNMAGSISPQVYTLEFLKQLDFSKNRIYNAGWDRIDEITTSETKLANLEVMDLTNNLINSVEGVDIFADTLTGLHMTYNNLKGTMPKELFELEKLEILAISENELSGKIDPDLGKLTNLLEFYCYGNKVTGEIPTQIGLLTKMQIMTFAENKLKGPLPEEIKNMVNLQTFSVHNNDPNTGAHTGPLPSFNTNPFLNEIFLDGNAFTGEIPRDFLGAYNGTSGETVTIGLSNNKLTGEIPVEFVEFDSLVLNVLGNQITGFHDGLCEADHIGDWMNGLVEMYGCDAILCADGTYSDTGRQEDDEEPCVKCSGGTDGKLGASTCDTEEIDTSPASQLEILAEFYLALGGPHQWDESDGWDAFAEMESAVDLTLPTYQEQNIDPCTFIGVLCDTGNKIIEISLPNNGLEGLVPDSFWNLQYLEELDLSGNELQLDRDFGFGNIGNAVALKKVDLSSNDIQSFKGIGKATSLQELYVDDAYFFSESLDTELYSLEDLRTLHLQFSGLKGKIPPGLSGLKNLKALNLYGNELTGNIPAEIGEMTKLWHVDFSENDFTGPLPADAIAKLVNLQKFHVHQSGRGGTGITGKLPSFKEQTQLHMLDVNSNGMTGSIPTDFLSGVTNVDQLMEIDIGYNGFTGTVPNTLKRFKNMRFAAEKNKLTAIGSEICAATDSISGWFNGEVGDVIAAGTNGCDAILCPKGTYNDYGRAKTGSDGDCSPCPSGKYLGQTGCDTTGDGKEDTPVNEEKEILDKLFIATSGKNWTTSEKVTWQDGPVCDYVGVECVDDSVTELNLAGFGLIGNIPTEIYKLPSLKSVTFSDNIVDLKFDGISEASKLETIIMDDADLSSLDGISDAPALKKLHISRNSFPEGTMPEEIYDISSLQTLQISYNGFEGSILPDVGNLVELEDFYAGSNDLTGIIPTEIAQLTKLKSLVLSGNRMSGQIPTELQDIGPLKQLHLNGQRGNGGFSGPLPSFKDSLHLGSIDFSRNSLTGSIPDDFLETLRQSTDHDDYAYDKIDLSSNQITGAVPANWDDFVGLFINLADNKITELPDVLCDDDDEFMDGLVGQLTENKCDAIMCRPGFYSAVGRQTEVNIPCEPCPGETELERKEQAPFYGQLKCTRISEERKILEELHDLIFSGASEDTNWMTEKPICSWYGITCDQNDSVTGIKLESNSLTTDDPDTVSSLIFSLPNLEALNIRGNKGLTLTFDDVGKPQHLEMLQLSATGLTSIDGIGQATKLKELHVTENDIGGPFPEGILGMTSMEKLYISFNKFTGTLPTELGELTDMKEFYAYTNDFNGTIPTELGNLIEMENLVIGKNNFEGSLPTELNNLANLKEFSVYYGGQLNGKILDFAKVTEIEKLDLEGNQFTGEIPSTFLSGLDGDYINKDETEIIIHLADNGLTGPLPEGLTQIKNLYLDLVGNQFTEIPASYCEQSSWMNGKVGELTDNPCHAIACPKDTFSVSGRMSNSDEACAPCGSDETAKFIGSYTCSHINSEFIALQKLYESTFGDEWENSDNWMDYDKPICSWYGITCAGDPLDNHTVTSIDLGDNALDGSMPKEIFEISTLETLILKENNIFIKFDNIGKAESLETLYISDVDIGSIDGIGKAPALKELHLTANELPGKFPNDFFELADTLEHLYIAYNSFSGTLSTEFGRMKNLVDFYAYDNDFTGTIPNELAKLVHLENFVVAENKLSGTIPPEFGMLPKLKLFSAYRRLKPGPKLFGPLPSFANVPQLQGLYLDYNHLTGAIPTDFLKNSLNTNLITISHNLLSGKVPLELLTFDELNIEMEGNKFVYADLDPKFCENPDWMDGLIDKYGCDALMCEPGYYSIYGRQNATDGSACIKCPADEDTTPYWGSTTCEGVVDEKEILSILYDSTGGDDWNDNTNWKKTDDVCTWYGVECRGAGDGKAVQVLRLGANNLVGTPSEQIFRLRQLHTLWLHSNPIDFKFKGISKAQNLVELRLDATGLSRVDGIGDATSLLRLDLKYNQLSGSFPTELFNLDKLESLHLTDNNLKGALPLSFGKLTNLQYLRLGSNQFSGELKPFNDLKSLIHLDLSNNKLVGTIPKTFLSGISGRRPIEVDLSKNSLSGGVPIELNRLNQLIIYLRENKFTSLDPGLCDEDNKAWNLNGVALYGCDAIMCPPKTANYHGRQSSETNPCLKCESNTNLYGQVTCDGLPLEVSSGSRIVTSVVAALVSSLMFGLLM